MKHLLAIAAISLSAFVPACQHADRSTVTGASNQDIATAFLRNAFRVAQPINIDLELQGDQEFVHKSYRCTARSAMLDDFTESSETIVFGRSDLAPHIYKNRVENSFSKYFFQEEEAGLIGRESLEQRGSSITFEVLRKQDETIYIERVVRPITDQLNDESLARWNEMRRQYELALSPHSTSTSVSLPGLAVAYLKCVPGIQHNEMFVNQWQIADDSVTRYENGLIKSATLLAASNVHYGRANMIQVKGDVEFRQDGFLKRGTLANPSNIDTGRFQYKYVNEVQFYPNGQIKSGTMAEGEEYLLQDTSNNRCKPSTISFGTDTKFDRMELTEPCTIAWRYVGRYMQGTFDQYIERERTTAPWSFRGE